MVRHNPCSYKQTCKKCQLVGESDRPLLCSGLECEHYTPCKKCEKNLDLTDGICKYCAKKGQEKKKTENALRGTAGIIDATDFELSDIPDETPVVSSERVSDMATITAPGEPLPHYTEDAKSYYLRQWSEYSGYYSDPTIYYVVHQIIIMEIELSIVSTTLSKFIVDDTVAPKLEKRRDKLIQNLASLRRQLPEKDALELSDDEKAMSMVYQRYMEEMHADTLGESNIRRVITPDAFALAPVMSYRIDPVELLTRLGYKLLNPDEVARNIESPPENPLDAAEFYGFKPREKYAMEVSRKFEELHENEDEFDDEDNGLVI